MSAPSHSGEFSAFNRESRPEDFFNRYVLQPGGEAEKKLRLWLSASSSEYMLQAKVVRRPRIWMLTGQYLLEDTQMLHIKSRKQQGSIATRALAIGALTGVPVGGSINISPDISCEAKLRTPDKLVWAAQFHKLKTNYVRVRSGEAPRVPRTISIYPNALSIGSAVRGEADESTFAQVALSSEVSGTMEETDDAEDSTAYETVLKNAVDQFEESFGEEES